MKKTILLTFCLILAFSLSALGQGPNFQSRRLTNNANQLKQATSELANRTSDGLKRGFSNSRNEIESAFLAQQLDASAELFRQLIHDSRRIDEFRDAASILTNLMRSAPNFGPNANLWRNVQNEIDDINRILSGGGGGGGGGGNNDDRPTSGRVFWRGTIDDRVQIIINGNRIRNRVLSGRTYPEGTYSFTSPLPNRNVEVDVDKKSGRGRVRVIQQPSRANGFTAIVEIFDGDGGAREYELEIFWK